MPQREFKGRDRKSSVRDSRLIVIAAEGTETEPQYFDNLARDDRYRNSRVHVEVLKREATTSSPAQIIQELDKFRQDYHLNKYDELWLVSDLDQWEKRGILSDVCAQCVQKRYLVAVSNPCFEIWLLLHLKSLDDYTAGELDSFMSAGRPKSNRHPLELELVRLVGRYNKSNLYAAAFLPHVELAIQRAEEADLNPEHRWPNQIGTRVYKLAQSIINSSRR